MPKPILCDKEGKWKEELEERLRNRPNEHVVLMAIGYVKYELMEYLNQRSDLNIIRIETRYLKKRSKGLGLKVTVIKKQSP